MTDHDAPQRSPRNGAVADPVDPVDPYAPPGDGRGDARVSGDVAPEILAAARAWYAIHLERCVDRWLEAVRPGLLPDVALTFLRARLHGGFRAIVSAITRPEPTAASAFIQRDIGHSVATLLGDPAEGMHLVRVGLAAALTDDLPAPTRQALAGRIDHSVSDVVFGYVRGSLVPRATPVAPEPGESRPWYAEMAATYPYPLVIDRLSDGTTVAINAHFERMLGYEMAEFLALSDDDITAAGAADDDYDQGIDLIAGRITVMERSSRLRHRDGHEVPVAIRIWTLPNPDGTTGYIASEFRPVADAAGDSHWERADKRFRHLARISQDALLIVAADGTIRYASPSTESNLGLDPDDAVGQPLAVLAIPEDHAAIDRLLRDLAAAPPRGRRQVELRLSRADGQSRWFEVSGANMLDVPELAGFAVQARDITDRRQLEEMLTRQALRDPLTGVLNRRGILQQIEAGIARYDATDEPTALLFLDLNGFKAINDRFGHAAGDAILVELTTRLTDVLGADSVAGRMGGDEFVAVLHGVRQDEAMAVAERIAVVLTDPVRVDGHEIRVGGGVGLVLTDRPGHSAGSLIRAADAALYRAKQIGDGRPALGHDPAA